MDELELGQVAFHAFGRATDYRGVLGEPLPRWEVLPAKLQQAFAACAQAVLDANGTPLVVPPADADSVLPPMSLEE